LLTVSRGHVAQDRHNRPGSHSAGGPRTGRRCAAWPASSGRPRRFAVGPRVFGRLSRRRSSAAGGPGSGSPSGSGTIIIAILVAAPLPRLLLMQRDRHHHPQHQALHGPNSWSSSPTRAASSSPVPADYSSGRSAVLPRDDRRSRLWADDVEAAAPYSRSRFDAAR
jgi:hypothetical protein